MSNTSKKLLKNRNWNFPVVRYSSWKLEFVLNTFSIIVVSGKVLIVWVFPRRNGHGYHWNISRIFSLFIFTSLNGKRMSKFWEGLDQLRWCIDFLHLSLDSIFKQIKVVECLKIILCLMVSLLLILASLFLKQIREIESDANIISSGNVFSPNKLKSLTLKRLGTGTIWSPVFFPKT